MFQRSTPLELEFTEHTATYLEGRLAMRKFDLGVSSAPLAASFFLLEHIKKVDVLWLDALFSVGMLCLTITAIISVVQIHRFSQCLGGVRSALAQKADYRGKIKFRPGIKGLNRLEILLNSVGYLVILLFLVREVWEFGA